jgi:DNA mismatch repair protein MutH
MERAEAVERLVSLKGKNLHEVAQQVEVNLFGPSGKVNKGWAGHTFERVLGLPVNSAQSPNFGSWELKVVPLKYLKNGRLVPKETMAVTMIDPYQVARTVFEESHLLSKLQKAVIVARTVGANVHEPSFVHDVRELNLEPGTDLYSIVREDYELVRSCLLDPDRGFDALTGSMGRLVQPRTKGAGHGSVSRAFYARPGFISSVFGLE